jgi:hypothetical protein
MVSGERLAIVVAPHYFLLPALTESWFDSATCTDRCGTIVSVFSFRNRMILSAEVASPYDINRVVLSDDGEELVEVLGPQGDENLWNAMELRLRGTGYPTRGAAISAGRLWRDRLTIAFAHVDRGIELGPDDTPDLPHYSYGRPHFVGHKGRKMRDAPKLVVFPSDNEPDWGSFYADFDHPYAIEGIINTQLAWLAQNTDWELTDKQKLAYKFVHGSLFESNAESVYILLFTGVEALIPKGFRAQHIIDALERLRFSLATMTDLDESAKDSLDNLLEYKENESIRYRGRNFVKILGDDLFDGKTPDKYFRDAYETRNKLAHANIARPSVDSLKEQIPELRRFLLALLDMTVFGELMPEW